MGFAAAPDGNFYVFGGYNNFGGTEAGPSPIHTSASARRRPLPCAGAHGSARVAGMGVCFGTQRCGDGSDLGIVRI